MKWKAQKRYINTAYSLKDARGAGGLGGGDVNIND